MELIGRATIHPALFYSGKWAGYVSWVLLGLAYAGVDLLPGVRSPELAFASFAASAIGIALIALSGMHLGRSTRLGLPTGHTTLKTGGVYRFSRNPMYLGFHALTLAAVLVTGSLFVLLPGLYSVVVYHLIILGEERFLQSAFGPEFERYRLHVRRYL